MTTSRRAPRAAAANSAPTTMPAGAREKPGAASAAAPTPRAWLGGPADIRSEKTGQLLARHLRQRIISGELPQGSRLPVEPELMQQFGVSRTTLREALRVLESECLVRVMRGSRGGPVVTRPDVHHSARYANIILQLGGATLNDVHEARQVIEPVIARLVAQRRSPENIRALRDALTLEAAALKLGNEAYAKAGSHFHDLLIQLSANVTLGVLAGTLNSIFERHMLSLKIPYSPDQNLNGQRAHKTHLQLVELIEAGNAQAAEELWSRHHRQAAPVVTRGQGDATISELHLD